MPTYDKAIIGAVKPADLEKTARALFKHQAEQGAHYPQDADEADKVPGMVEAIPAWRKFEGQALAAILSINPDLAPKAE